MKCERRGEQRESRSPCLTPAPPRLFSHVGDPFLDDPLPREYVLYLRPTGPLAQKLSDFWQQSKQICGKNKAHNIFPHITLCQFFMVSRTPALPDGTWCPDPSCLAGPGVTE